MLKSVKNIVISLATVTALSFYGCSSSPKDNQAEEQQPETCEESNLDEPQGCESSFDGEYTFSCGNGGMFDVNLSVAKAKWNAKIIYYEEDKNGMYNEKPSEIKLSGTVNNNELIIEDCKPAKIDFKNGKAFARYKDNVISLVKVSLYNRYCEDFELKAAVENLSSDNSVEGKDIVGSYLYGEEPEYLEIVISKENTWTAEGSLFRDHIGFDWFEANGTINGNGELIVKNGTWTYREDEDTEKKIKLTPGEKYGKVHAGVIEVYEMKLWPDWEDVDPEKTIKLTPVEI